MFYRTSSPSGPVPKNQEKKNHQKGLQGELIIQVLVLSLSLKMMMLLMSNLKYLSQCQGPQVLMKNIHHPGQGPVIKQTLLTYRMMLLLKSFLTE